MASVISQVFHVHVLEDDVYRVSVSEAIQFNVTMEGGSGGIPDAPFDGSIYGRQDGAWVVAAGSGAVDSVFGRTGDVVAQDGDYSPQQLAQQGALAGQVLTWNDTLGYYEPQTPTGGGGAVDSVFGRTGTVIAATNDYTWAQVDKTTSDIADLALRSHTSLTDIGVYSHDLIDGHIDSTANPHAVTAAQVGLNTTDDLAQGILNLYYSDALVSANVDVAANTAHRNTVTGNPHDLDAADVGAAPTVHTHTLSNILQSGAVLNQVPQWTGLAWVPATLPSAPVDSVFGRTGAVIAQTGDYATNQVPEDINFLYYTDGRVAASGAVSANTAHRNTLTGNPHALDTDDVPAGTLNLYFPEAPEDGGTYARKDAGWAQVTSGAQLPLGLGTWAYSATTTTPPATGQIRFDNAAPALATKLYIHETDGDGVDKGNVLGAVLETGAEVYIQERADKNTYWIATIGTVTDQGTWVEADITGVSLQGTLSDADEVVFILLSQAATTAPVTSVFGRTDVVTAQAGDYSPNQLAQQGATQHQAIAWNDILMEYEPQDILADLAFSDIPGPSGFVDQAESTIAFVDATRTFTITPVGASYYIWVDFERLLIDSPRSIVIPDVEGSVGIRFDINGDLESLPYEEHQDTSRVATVSEIYWDATNKKSLFTGDIRHATSMSGSTRNLLGSTMGSLIEKGLGLGDFTTDDSGDLDIHAQFSAAAGSFWLQDIEFDVVGSARPVAMPVFYLEGAGPVWRRQDSSNFPVRNFPTGDQRLAYNELTGGVWQQTEVSNNDFVLAHIFATNDESQPFLAIQGQNIYTLLTHAKLGAVEEVKSLYLNGFISNQLLLIGTIIYQTSNSYTNAVKGKVRTTDTGADYVDWRRVTLTPGAGPANHENLLNVGLYLHTEIDDHIDSVANPHGVTFTQAVTADAGTDITAAEAEILTDGSNADALHSHEDFPSFSDANFEIFNSTDPTKIANFDASGITTATTRTYDLPDAAGTLALTSDIPTTLPASAITAGTFPAGTFTFQGQVNTGILNASSNVVADAGSSLGSPILDSSSYGFKYDIQNNPGGWAKGLGFYDDTLLLGAFYGFGPVGALTRLGIAAAYNSAPGVHLDLATGFVGINDLTPSYELDVDGDARVTGELITTDLTATGTITGIDAGDVGAHGKAITKIFYIKPSEASSSFPIFSLPAAATITRVTFQTDAGTVDFNLEKRAEATPFVAGTNVFTVDDQASTTNSIVTTFGSASLAANDWLWYAASAVSTPGAMVLKITYEEN